MSIRILSVTWNATNGIQFSTDAGFICLKDAQTVVDLAASDKMQRNINIVKSKINRARSRAEREELNSRLQSYQQKAVELAERVHARALRAVEAGYARPDFGTSMSEPFLD